jgi:hypothetical protein
MMRGQIGRAWRLVMSPEWLAPEKLNFVRQRCVGSRDRSLQTKRVGVVEPTRRHIDVLRFDTKGASTAFARAPFGGVEQRRANPLAARIGRDTKVPEKRARRTIAKEVDLRIVDNDDRSSHTARAVVGGEHTPPTGSLAPRRS